MPHDPAICENVMIGEVSLPKAVADVFRRGAERDSVGATGPSSVEPDLNLMRFGSLNEWLTSLLFVGVMHAVPGISQQDAVEVAQTFGRQLGMPGSLYLWRQARNYMMRTGMKGSAARIEWEFRRAMTEAKEEEPGDVLDSRR